MIKGTIEFEGETLNEVELVIIEARRKIIGGCISGFDSNSLGRYNFKVTEE